MAQDKDFRIEDENAGKSLDWSIFKRLWAFIKPHKKFFIISLVLLIVATGLQLLIPNFTRIAIDSYMNDSISLDVSVVQEEGYYKLNDDIYLKLDDKGDIKPVFTDNGYEFELNGEKHTIDYEIMRKLRHDDLNNLKTLVLILVSLLFVNFICTYGQVMTSNVMGQRVILDIRKSLFSHLLKLPLSFYDKNPTGRIVTRVSNDAQNLNEFFTAAVTSIIKDVIMLIGIIAFMVYLSSQLTLYSMIIIPFIILSTILFRMFARKAYRRVRTRLARINAFLAEHLSGMSVIQLFNRENSKKEEFREINESYYKATIQQLFVFAIFRPTMDLLYYLALSVIIWFGAKDLIAGSITFGMLYAFISYIDMFFTPLKDISEKYDIVQNAFASAEKIFKLFDEDEGIIPENLEGKKDIVMGDVEFKNVKFTYDGSKDILKGISFKADKGEKIAIVGETGAGKTTLMSILTSLYRIREGEILIDGVSIYDYNKYELRKKIAIVLQDVFIFSGSVLDNIRLFDENISDEETVNAAQFVHVDNMIRRFEDGFNTMLNERASTLSAGERQLIALARAVVRDPKILILDEATSNIDPVTEGYIQDAMEKVSMNRTVITIAHRISTIKNADRILVMHKGRIVESGKHEELIRNSVIYKQLYKLQYELS